MTKLLVAASFLFAACSDPAPTATPPAAPPTGAATANQPGTNTAGLTGGLDEPSVDPTVPSWTPRSCLEYHKVVVEALDCDAIEQTKRDLIQEAYGAASKEWKAESDGTPARILQVAEACERSTASVQADSAGKCVLAKT